MHSDRAADLRRVKLGVVAGSALEWFDFYLYASMAALVLGRVFFPSTESATGTLAAFATFAVGFIARPVGGALFGILGDKIGRRRVLSATFLLMGFSSVAMGLLPSYDTIGVAAPIMLVLLRIGQGLGAGAEGSTAAVLSYEHAREGDRAKQAAWPALGSNIGLFASSLTVAVLTSADRDFLDSWGWRLPFLASALLVVVGYWARKRVPETPEFEHLEAEEPQRKTIRQLIQGNWRGLAVVGVMYVGFAAASYTFKTFSLSYLAEFRDVAPSVGAFGISIASVVAICIVPVAGRLADQYSPRAVLMWAALATVGWAFPFFVLLDSGGTLQVWIALVVASGLIMPTVLAAAGAFNADQFPTEVRASGVTIGREVGGAAAGGIAPLLALSLVTASDTNATWPVSLMFVACGVSMLVSCAMDQRGARNQSPATSHAKDAV